MGGRSFVIIAVIRLGFFIRFFFVFEFRFLFFIILLELS